MRRGSISVEASIIVSVTLLGTFWIFFMSCYLMDIHKIHAVIIEAAWQGMQNTEQAKSVGKGKIDWKCWSEKTVLWRLTDNFEEEKQIILSYVKKQLQGNLWFQNSVEIQVIMESDKIRILYEGDYRFPIDGFWTISTGRQGIPIEGEVVFESVEAEEFLRLVKGIVRGAGKTGEQMEIKFIKNHNRNYIAFMQEETEVCLNELRMLQYNSLSYLLAADIRRVDNQILCCYDISGRQPMTFLYGRVPVRGAEIRSLISGIESARKELEEYLMGEDGLILKPEYLYLQAMDFNWQFCYTAGKNNSFKTQIQELLQFLLDHVDYKDSESVGLAYGLYQKGQESDYDFDMLLKYINELGIASMQEMPCDLKCQEEIPRTHEESNRIFYSQDYKRFDPENRQEGNWWYKLRAGFFRGIKRKNEMLRLNFENQEAEKDIEELHDEIIPVKEHFKTQSLEEQEEKRQFILKPVSENLYIGQGGLEQIALSQFPFIIGTVKDSVDGCINSPFISRFHARLLMEENALYIEDLNSTNGTFVNHIEVFGEKRQMIKAGDEVAFANLTYRLEVHFIQ